VVAGIQPAVRFDTAPLPASMLTRVATAVVLIPLFVWVVIGAPPWLFQLLVVAASALGAWELTRLLDRAGRAVYARLAIALSALVTASFTTVIHGMGSYAATTPGWVPAPAGTLTLAVGVVLTTSLWSERPATESVANTLLAVVYVGWLLGYAIPLHHLVNGGALVLFLVGVTWAGESAAYMIGSAVGRHPLAPTISPRKTIEGAVAQVVLSIAAAGALGAVLLPGCAIGRSLVAGVVLGVVGQIGDLTESVIKRNAGAKDTGRIIPGHGGLLDRIDSLLFNVPAYYFLSTSGGCAS
jgi:phosphatidate cytidylyltransferase